jgi:hypothetical protein
MDHDVYCKNKTGRQCYESIACVHYESYTCNSFVFVVCEEKIVKVFHKNRMRICYRTGGDSLSNALGCHLTKALLSKQHGLGSRAIKCWKRLLKMATASSAAGPAALILGSGNYFRWH